MRCTLDLGMTPEFWAIIGVGVTLGLGMVRLFGCLDDHVRVRGWRRGGSRLLTILTARSVGGEPALPSVGQPDVGPQKML